jgi:hypothetical protein
MRPGRLMKILPTEIVPSSLICVKSPDAVFKSFKKFEISFNDNLSALATVARLMNVAAINDLKTYDMFWDPAYSCYEARYKQSGHVMRYQRR